MKNFNWKIFFASLIISHSLALYGMVGDPTFDFKEYLNDTTAGTLTGRVLGNIILSVIVERVFTFFKKRKIKRLESLIEKINK